MPVYASWIADISVFRYALDAVMFNEFSGRPLQCDTAEIASGTCTYPSGDELLSTFGMGSSSSSTTVFGRNAGLLVALIMAGHLLAMLAFWWRDRRSRK